jgi:RNA polymerase sigma-70 factor, ECF subfamily
LKRAGDDAGARVTLGGMKGLCEAELLDLDSALEELKALNARQADIVERRFFGGQTTAETAGMLGISQSAVERDWRVARAWLKNKLRPQQCTAVG